MLRSYLRLLRYARPLSRFVPVYLVSTALSVLFGLVNFTLLIPLLDVLFDRTGRQITQAPAAGPFRPDIAWAEETFRYHFTRVALAEGPMGALWFVCGLLVASVLLANIFRYISVVSVEGLRARVVRQLRQAIYEHTVSLDLSFFSQGRKGDLMARLTTDVYEVEHSVANTFAALLREPLTLVAYLIALFRLSPELTLFAFLVLPVSGIVIGLVAKSLRRTAHLAQDLQGQLLGIIDETLSGMRIVMAYNAQRYLADKFLNVNAGYQRLFNRIARRRELAPAWSEFTGVAMVAVILLYGGNLVLAGEGGFTASQFVTYLALFSQVLRPAKALGQSFSNIQRGLASGERIYQILDTTPRVRTPGTPLPLPSGPMQEGIHFEGVSFTYGDRPTLEGIDLTLRPGETVALVGPSGGGKSTLADLLLRYYDPTEGRILIEGKPLDSIDLEAWRGRIGVVSQETILFHDTVRANIAFCRPGSTDEQLIEAAKAAGAWTFIEALPEGLDTIIGDRGLRLSGGQRQRLAIARALLADPEILVLDEATSALDSASEQEVQASLTRLMAGRTALVIAHRLSTIRHADLIVVIEAGRMVEQGTHESLIARPDGVYRRLCAAQGIV